MGVGLGVWVFAWGWVLVVGVSGAFGSCGLGVDLVFSRFVGLKWVPVGYTGCVGLI